MKKFGSKLWTGRLMPGCQHHRPWSDAYLECLARTYTFPNHHHIGN